MKQLLITIAALVLVGCGPPKAPDISIHEAAAKGDIAAVKQHLAAGSNVNAKSGGFTSPPLLLTVLNSHINTAKLLIASGADLGGKDKFGNTPLHYAAKNGSKEIIALLIVKNADVNAKDKAGETPLDVAANKETADLLSQHNAKYGTFIGAVAGGDIDAVKMFLNAGTDVNAKVQHGWTSMHEAAVFGHAEVAKLLIKNGANVNAWDGYETPLDVSADESEFADLLRKHGAKTGEEFKAEGK